jgi:hypothetical protein
MFGSDLGRLTYRSKDKAQSVARDLGLSGTHSHVREGMTVHMPGKDHEKLNKALEARGLPPTQMSGGMSEEMEMGRDAAMDEDDMDEMLFGDSGTDTIMGDEDGDGDMELY